MSSQSAALGFGAASLIDEPVSHQPGWDEASLNLVISTSYRHVFGNTMPMESERLVSAESQLRNGDINVREFVRALAKSSFYRSRFFESVAPHRSVELAIKHLLGRPPIDQEEVSTNVARIASEGFDANIDALINSDEYTSAFGDHTAPHIRSWNSPIGARQSSFNSIAALEKNFAGSDSAMVSGSQLLYSLAKGQAMTIRFPAQVYRSRITGGFSGTG